MKNFSAGIFLSWEKYIKEKMKVNTKISNKGFDISGMFLFFQKISLWEIGFRKIKCVDDSEK